ncbi:Basic-leucine zipper domain protein [Kalmanozyma brasiliensis GHG001]|uniref:BZIP domain-containing protein n=1 Tax=Kalmanozyma brasiliensis (strain GHG001) TaxID=1365824 RepID=V5EWK8_KALBG|nr:Basic-leucine zipper domain protein [Kalmanozyma brasiliensis GHG001]EST06699.1 Basic-leucine zipper domain protein [Kalmanozyma brasiliensis GHG001]
MPFEESPNSFLFGLNQFTSPGADSQNESGSNSRADNMLANLDAFAVADDVATGTNHNEATPGQAPNFADQLALWTNANFSFDGPTGHALLGDEEKEKEEAEHNRRREDENRRNQEEERERLARNAAASSRGSHALRGKARDFDSNASSSAQPYAPNSQPHTPSAHPSQHSHQHQQQSQQSFFPSAPNFNANVRPSPATNPSGPGVGAPFGLFNGFQNVQQQQSAQQPSPQPGFGSAGSLDMTSALALQHLLASNPLALASLSQLAGLTNPQLQSHLAGIVNAGAGGFGNFNQSQQGAAAPQQSPQAPNNASVGPGLSPWLAAQSLAASRNGSLSGPSPQNVNWAAQLGGSSGLPAASPAAANTAPAPASSGANGIVNGAGPNHTSNDSSARQSDEASGSTAPSKKKRTSTSEGKKAQLDDPDDSDEILGRLEDIERRYEIPPLKLIDTGNPEADAEANRQAIEEDKRRRNTAASARFRIKKKQREAQLEQAAKELHQRLADLEAENARLRTENGWLKSLITVRPDQAMPGGLDQSAVPNPFSSLAGPSGSQGPATAHASPAPNGVAGETERQSGLHPRGVGTAAEDNAKAKAKNAANGSTQKRDREE